jgi:hypothetical protein
MHKQRNNTHIDEGLFADFLRFINGHGLFIDRDGFIAQFIDEAKAKYHIVCDVTDINNIVLYEHNNRIPSDHPECELVFKHEFTKAYGRKAYKQYQLNRSNTYIETHDY